LRDAKGGKQRIEYIHGRRRRERYENMERGFFASSACCLPGCLAFMQSKHYKGGRLSVNPERKKKTFVIDATHFSHLNSSSHIVQHR
jgi:hypothetical protein